MAGSLNNRLGQYATANCYAELTVSSLGMTMIITSNHCAYPQKDGQAELPCVAG